jgi:hypothetical protein
VLFFDLNNLMQTVFSIPLIFIEQQRPGYWLRLNEDIQRLGCRCTDTRALDIFHHVLVLEMSQENTFVFGLQHPELLEFQT